MDPELKRTLEELKALTKDNHRMLRAIRRSQWLSFFSTVIIWAAVLLIPLYLYQQYVSPMVEKISAVSGFSTSTTSGLLGLPSSAELQKLLDYVKSGQ